MRPEFISDVADQDVADGYQIRHPGLRLAYVCDMCGLELAVLKVAKERAPKHCGETMTLVRRPAEVDD